MAVGFKWEATLPLSMKEFLSQITQKVGKSTILNKFFVGLCCPGKMHQILVAFNSYVNSFNCILNAVVKQYIIYVFCCDLIFI